MGTRLVINKAPLTGGATYQKMKYTYNDGGRAAAGYRGRAKGDCVARAIAIASGRPYKTVCDEIDALASRERTGKRKRSKSSSQGGVWKATTQRYLRSIGWTWTPTMAIGSGCKVHLRSEELPSGRIIVSVSRHYVAVLDGVVNDIYDPSRHGSRCVYGYWSKK